MRISKIHETLEPPVEAVNEYTDVRLVVPFYTDARPSTSS